MLAIIPGPATRYPLIGNIDMVWNNCNQELSLSDYLFKGLTQVYKKHGIFKFFIANRFVVTIYNHKLLKDLLKCNVNITKPFEYQLLSDWLGKGLLINGSADHWRYRRKLLTPAFHNKIVDQFVPIFNDKSDLLLDRLRDASDKDFVNICDLIFPAALDIICETGMGIKINAQQNQNQEYIDAIQDMGRILIARIFKPHLWLNCVFYLVQLGKQFNHNLNISHKLTRSVINDRKQQLIQNSNKGNTGLNKTGPKNTKRLAFLDLLLAHHLNDNTLTLDDIREEVDTFMFAGHDTAAICLSWTLYFIGLYPEIQRKLQKELDTVLMTNNQDMTINDTKQMVYLDAVIKESLRLRPPVPFIIRAITQDIQLGPYLIPKDVSIVVNLDSLHQDPDVYVQPLKFKPERFLDDRDSMSPFAYIPFSAGVRNCIGQKFVAIELKIVLAKVLSNFEIQSLDQIDRIIEYNAIVKKPKYGIRIKVKPRMKAR